MFGCGETGRSGSTSAPPVSSSLTKARLMANPRSDRLAATSDRTEMLVDAEHDQDEFGDDPREQHADRHPQQAAQQHEHADAGAGRHHLYRGPDAGEAEQNDEGDGQPEEQLDDRGRDEALPLKQVAKAEHRWVSPVAENPCAPVWVVTSLATMNDRDGTIVSNSCRRSA